MPIESEGISKEELIELGWVLLDMISPSYGKETMFGKRDSDLRYYEMISDGYAYYYLLELQQGCIKITKTSTGGFTGNSKHQEQLYYGKHPSIEELKLLEKLLDIPETSFSVEQEQEKYDAFWNRKRKNI